MFALVPALVCWPLITNVEIVSSFSKPATEAISFFVSGVPSYTFVAELAVIVTAFLLTTKLNVGIEKL